MKNLETGFLKVVYFVFWAILESLMSSAPSLRLRVFTHTGQNFASISFIWQARL
jgi:hypothetical protein